MRTHFYEIILRDWINMLDTQFPSNRQVREMYKYYLLLKIFQFLSQLRVMEGTERKKEIISLTCYLDINFE